MSKDGLDGSLPVGHPPRSHTGLVVCPGDGVLNGRRTEPRQPILSNTETRLAPPGLSMLLRRCGTAQLLGYRCLIFSPAG